MRTYIKKAFFLLSVIFCNIVLLFSHCSAQQDLISTPQFSIDFKDKELIKAIREISTITGYDILLSGEKSVDDHRISGNFRCLGAFECLNKILRNCNKAIIVNERRKQILVYMPGPSKENPFSPKSYDQDTFQKIGLDSNDHASNRNSGLENINEMPVGDPYDNRIKFSENQKILKDQGKEILPRIM